MGTVGAVPVFVSTRLFLRVGRPAAPAAVVIGTASPMPMKTSSAVGLIRAVTMPTTWPSRLRSGPPEFPGLTAASIWISPCRTCELFGSWKDRPRPDTTPELIEPVSAKGLPTA